MDKEELEYVDKYGDIPKCVSERMSILLQGSNRNLRGTIFPQIQRLLHTEWETVNITVWLVPKATPRPRYSSCGHVFYVKGAADNRKRFYKFIERTGLKQISTPCRIRILSYLPTPSAMNKAEKILAELGLIAPISKPDWDNLGKTYSDMIQEKLLLDDSLIFRAVSDKLYSIKPRIEISLSYMKEFDCKYNQNKIEKMIRKE